MSTTTDVLSLFKYDPVADADSTFNITQALNNNWDKLDAAILLAIAAAGAYNPEESYAVGDYCTYQGKLRKCSTAIPTGETWTEAHWTTTTVAAEMAELSSQLSNLQSMKLSVSAPGTACADLHTAANGLLHIAPSEVGAGATANAPDGISWAIAQKFGVGLIHTILAVDCIGRAWVEGYDGGTWNGWKPLATATPPQEFDLPLAEGVTPVTGFKNTYSKDQFGVVRVWFSTHFESIPTSGAHVFYLPEGFRPDFICPFTAHFSMGEFYNVAVSIHPSGDALVDHGTIGQTGPINLHGFIEFPAD